MHCLSCLLSFTCALHASPISVTWFEHWYISCRIEIKLSTTTTITTTTTTATTTTRTAATTTSTATTTTTTTILLLLNRKKHRVLHFIPFVSTIKRHAMNFLSVTYCTFVQYTRQGFALGLLLVRVTHRTLLTLFRVVLHTHTHIYIYNDFIWIQAF